MSFSLASVRRALSHRHRRLAAATALLLAAGLPVAGCSPTGVALGAGAVAGTAALEERGFEQSVRDKADALTIQKRLADYDFDTFRRVDAAVWEGRVLLTGVVPEPEDRLQAVQIAWRTEGVVDVVNEILIGESVGTIDTTRDLRIAAELRSAITLDADVKAINYILEAVAGTVYLFGVAQSEAELARVKAHAREIQHVRRIVSHVLLVDSAEREALLEELRAELRRLDAEDADDETAAETEPGTGESDGSERTGDAEDAAGSPTDGSDAADGG